jgi:toxin secretion/phage lysis holin
MQATTEQSSWLVASKWVAALVVSCWASIPPTVQTLLILMVVDYVTGLLCAAKRGRISYGAGMWGLVRKTVTLLVVMTASRVLAPLHLPFDFGATVAGAYVINEAISIMKNARALGVWTPAVMQTALERAKKLASRETPGG